MMTASEIAAVTGPADGSRVDAGPDQEMAVVGRDLVPVRGNVAGVSGLDLGPGRGPGPDLPVDVDCIARLPSGVYAQPIGHNNISSMVSPAVCGRPAINRSPINDQRSMVRRHLMIVQCLAVPLVRWARVVAVFTIGSS